MYILSISVKKMAGLTFVACSKLDKQLAWFLEKRLTILCIITEVNSVNKPSN